MSLDRQRHDNLAALSAGRPIPQYGQPRLSDMQIQLEKDKISWWSSLVNPIFKLFNLTPPLSEQLTAIHRAELYPEPHHLTAEQVERLHSNLGLRKFSYRSFDTAVYYLDLFMAAIDQMATESNVDIQTGHLLNMVSYRRTALDKLYGIQHSIDGQLENAHRSIRLLISFFQLDTEVRLRNAEVYLNRARATIGFPPFPLEDHLVEAAENQF